MSINIHEFMKKFSKEYSFLYDHHDRVAGYREAVECFDYLIHNSESFKNFVSEFVAYRKDIISSDREAAAFMFAMESFRML